MANISSERLFALISDAGLRGLTPEVIARDFSGMSRSTLNRRLAELTADKVIRPIGAGRSTRYISTAPMTRASIDDYFAVDARERIVGPVQ